MFDAFKWLITCVYEIITDTTDFVGKFGMAMHEPRIHAKNYMQKLRNTRYKSIIYALCMRMKLWSLYLPGLYIKKNWKLFEGQIVESHLTIYLNKKKTKMGQEKLHFYFLCSRTYQKLKKTCPFSKRWIFPSFLQINST